MTDLDPRALVRAALIDATDTYPGDVVHTDALARVQAYSLAALALTLPQGTVDIAGETTGAVTPKPPPAEPSLVALDRAEANVELIVAVLAEHRVQPNYRCACGFNPNVSNERMEWHQARIVADRIGGAL